jgi:ribosomal protein S18 acetylase RimI-like enzyme
MSGMGDSLMLRRQDALVRSNSLGEEMARDAHASGLSLIVASENKLAHGLYVKLGYQEIESRPLVSFPGGPDGGEWVLMVKNLN